ncbi:hypothetical protein [Streptomyces sp. NPDC097640]|uniref:hypothetical protein n=1 Tax=Streptomyces sp. NPDC097640 TaxID=3157229 RepID=UPI003333EFCA
MTGQPPYRALLARLEEERAKSLRNAPLCTAPEARLVNEGMAAAHRIDAVHVLAVFEGPEAAAAYMRGEAVELAAAGVADAATPAGEARPGRAVLFVTVDAPDDAHAVRWAGILRDLVHAEHGDTMRLHTAIELETENNPLDIPPA